MMETERTSGGAPFTATAPSTTGSKALVPITGQELEMFSQATEDPSAVKQQLMMRDALAPDQKSAAQAEATQVYNDMKANPQVVVNFGSSATAEVDQVGEELLSRVGGEHIDVIEELLKGLNDGMRKIQRGYDVKTNPEAREKYDAWSGKLKKLLHLGKDFFEMMLEDFQKFDTQLDKASKKLGEEEQLMSRNLGFYDQLYKANQHAIDKLVYVIAVMEYVSEMAASEASAITVDQNQPDWQRKREERDRLAQLAENMQVKAGDFKGIYMISLATSPQVRMSSNQVLGVISKLETVKTQTIGAMRRILAQWIMLIQSQDAMALASFVAENNEEWTQRYFEGAPELIASIAEGVEKPMLSVQTIEIMAKSLEDSSSALVTAMQKGHQDRLAVDDAIRAALPQINAAGAKVSDETIKLVLGRVVTAAQKQEAELSTSTPA